MYASASEIKISGKEGFSDDAVLYSQQGRRIHLRSRRQKKSRTETKHNAVEEFNSHRTDD